MYTAKAVVKMISYLIIFKICDYYFIHSSDLLRFILV